MGFELLVLIQYRQCQGKLSSRRWSFAFRLLQFKKPIWLEKYFEYKWNFVEVLRWKIIFHIFPSIVVWLNLFEMKSVLSFSMDFLRERSIASVILSSETLSSSVKLHQFSWWVITARNKLNFVPKFPSLFTCLTTRPVPACSANVAHG